MYFEPLLLHYMQHSSRQSLLVFLFLPRGLVRVYALLGVMCVHVRVCACVHASACACMQVRVYALLGVMCVHVSLFFMTQKGWSFYNHI